MHTGRAACEDGGQDRGDASIGLSKKFIPVFPLEGIKNPNELFGQFSRRQRSPNVTQKSPATAGKRFPAPLPAPLTSDFPLPGQRRCVCYLLSRVQLCDPIDCNPPGSSVHGILQARILGWWGFASPFCRASSPPRDGTRVCGIGRWILYHLIHQGSPLGQYVCCLSPSLWGFVPAALENRRTVSLASSPSSLHRCLS